MSEQATENKNSRHAKSAARQSWQVILIGALTAMLAFMICMELVPGCDETKTDSVANKEFLVRAYYIGCGALDPSSVQVRYVDRTGLIELEHHLAERRDAGDATLELVSDSTVAVTYYMGDRADGRIDTIDTVNLSHRRWWMP